MMDLTNLSVIGTIQHWNTSSLILFILFLLAVHRYIAMPYWKMRNTNIPLHPTNYFPFIEVLATAFKGQTNRHSELVRKYKDAVCLTLGARQIVLITNPRIAEIILVKKFRHFRDRQNITWTKHPLNLGLLEIKGDHWKRVRATVSPTFSAAKLKKMTPIIESCIDLLIHEMSKEVEGKENIDVFRWIGTLASDVALRTAFGVTFPVHGKEYEIFYNQVKMAVRFPRFLFLFDLLGIPSRIYGLLNHYFIGRDWTYFTEMLKDVIKQRRNAVDVSATRKDLLQLMLSEDVEGLPKLTDDEVMAQAVTFLIASYDTTRNAIACTLYLLALHPDVQEKLFYEIINSSFDDEIMDRYDAVLKLEYLDQVFCESLRLYPPAHWVFRLADDDVKVDKYIFPKDMQILFPLYSFHHSERFWDSPEKFCPGRFAAEARSSIVPFSFSPFSYGPRNCIGARFAQVEAKLSLARLLKEFKFEKCPLTEIPLTVSDSIVSSPKNGIFLKVSRRSNKAQF